MNVHEMGEKLSLKMHSPEDDRAIKGVFCCDMLSVAMAKAPADYAWITVIGNSNTVAVATLTDVACVVLAEGYDFDEAAVKAAAGKVALLKSKHPVYETAISIGSLLQPGGQLPFGN